MLSHRRPNGLPSPRDDDMDRKQKPMEYASKEGIVSASIALYLIFYYVLHYAFTNKLEDPEVFKSYTLFFLFAFLMLTVVAIMMVFQKPYIMKNEYMGMPFFILGGLILFVLPYSGAMDIALPLPDVGLLAIGGLCYTIGFVIFLRYGGYFTPWLVGSLLTVVLAGHEALQVLLYTGHFGEFDQLLWNLGISTLTMSFMLFLAHVVKVRYILVPLIEKGNKARRGKKYKEALKHFDRSLALFPHFTTGLNNKGNVLLNMGKYKEARECYEKALEIDPFYENARHNLKILKGKAGR